MAASIVKRRWLGTLATVVDHEDFDQQAWVIFLEGLPIPPAGVNPAVWEVGRIASRLHAWARRLYRRVQREVAWPEDLDFSGPSQDAEGFLDAVAAAEVMCSPEELACVYFKFLGYRESQSQEILGITQEAYRQRLHRLRTRLSNARS